MASETTNLESLKARVANPSSPKLELAEDLLSYQTANSLTQRDLGARLGGEPPLRSELLGLLKLPSDIKERIRGQAISLREIRKLDLKPVEPVESGVEQSVEREINALNRVESGLPPVECGYPLIRDTLNGFAGLIFFWSKDFRLGNLAERF